MARGWSRDERWSWPVGWADGGWGDEWFGMGGSANLLGGCGQGLGERERQALDMDWNGHGMEIGDWDRRWRMEEGRDLGGPWKASAVADKSWGLRLWEACKKTGFMNRWWWVDSGSCTSTCAWMEWSGVEWKDWREPLGWGLGSGRAPGRIGVEEQWVRRDGMMG